MFFQYLTENFLSKQYPQNIHRESFLSLQYPQKMFFQNNGIILKESVDICMTGNFFCEYFEDVILTEDFLWIKFGQQIVCPNNILRTFSVEIISIEMLMKRLPMKSLRQPSMDQTWPMLMVSSFRLWIFTGKASPGTFKGLPPGKSGQPQWSLKYT